MLWEVACSEEEGSTSYTSVWFKSINKGFSVLMEFLAEAPKRCQMEKFLPFICLGFSTSSCRGPRAVYVVLDCQWFCVGCCFTSPHSVGQVSLERRCHVKQISEVLGETSKVLLEVQTRKKKTSQTFKKHVKLVQQSFIMPVVEKMRTIRNWLCQPQWKQERSFAEVSDRVYGSESDIHILRNKSNQ